MNTTHLLIYGLAIWRISSLFVREDGPYYVFRKIRELVGIEHDPEGQVFMIPDTLLGGIFSCVWCFSTWASFGMTAFWLFFPEYSLRFAVLFAFSAIAIIVDKKLLDN